MPTKENRTSARSLIEGLESRVHAGPPIHQGELHSAREFLEKNQFSPLSDYHNRLAQVSNRVTARSREPAKPHGKRNYGGEAAGYWMQVQSVYDHVILSLCYDGELNSQFGRIKISHRFNQAGRIDFVELKFLRSLQPCLTGEVRKLLLVKDYQVLPRDWHAAEAFVLEVLPRELVFLYGEIFHCPRGEVCAWLLNIGHRLVEDMLADLRSQPANGENAHPGRNPDQLGLRAVLTDEVARPILERAARLETAVDVTQPKSVVVRYLSTGR